MKTLFITNTYLTGNSGGVYATKAYINAFAKLSEQMTVVYAMKEGAEAKDIIMDNVTMVPVWDSRTRIHKYIDLCLGVITRFQKSCFKIITPEIYDTVVFNNSEASSGLINKFKKLGLNVITIHHNYQIEYLKGDCNIICLLPKLFWTNIYERRAVRYSDLNLVLTNEDAELLKFHYGDGRFENIGIFEYKEISLGEKHNTNNPYHKYVITGWLGSKQTEDSLIPWIKDYYPILKEVDPTAVLIIAGRDPSPKLFSIARRNGINVIASPPDMQPILDKSDYYICPTNRGGGLKLRILDGLKSGLPVLTHVISARGYDYMQQLGMVKAYDSHESFKSQLKEMLSLPYSKNQVVTEYANYYSLMNGVNKLYSILTSAEILAKDV